MEHFEIIAYGVLFVLNVLIGWACMGWMRRKGYADSAWVALVVSVAAGFVIAVLLVSFLPGRAHPAHRRPLNRPMLRPRLPQPKIQRQPVPYGSLPPQPSDAR
ncbi:MAG: hypothetical protein KF696_02585 [Planctomycetes bacterium]|nr:hypothetical protein [Planctomycetota bacterium]MCW8134890.1 hypothetical protein [Planctomycetota bacterium]